jgi:hypothetical protein
MKTMKDIIDGAKFVDLGEEKFASSRADADAARSVKAGEARRKQLKDKEEYIDTEVSKVQKGMAQLAKEIGQLSDSIGKKAGGGDLNSGDILFISARADQMSDRFLKLHHYANFLRGLRGV